MRVKHFDPPHISDGGTVTATLAYDPHETGDVLISADDDLFQVSPASHTPASETETETIPLTITANPPLTDPKMCFLTFTRGGSEQPGAVRIVPMEPGS